MIFTFAHSLFFLKLYQYTIEIYKFLFKSHHHLVIRFIECVIEIRYSLVNKIYIIHLVLRFTMRTKGNEPHETRNATCIFSEYPNSSTICGRLPIKYMPHKASPGTWRRRRCYLNLQSKLKNKVYVYTASLFSWLVTYNENPSVYDSPIPQFSNPRY